MNTFGTIKTKIENTAIELSKKSEFKRFIFEFKHLVLENKDLSELYYIYDDLSSNKGLPIDIANDYINESIEYSQILLESQNNRLKDKLILLLRYHQLIHVLKTQLNKVF